MKYEFVSKTGLTTYLIPTEYRNTYFGKRKQTLGRLHIDYYHGGNNITFSDRGTKSCKFPRTTKCYKCGYCFFGCPDDYIFSTKNYFKRC